MKTLSLIAGLAVFGIVGCKKNIPAQKASPAAATTDQGTIVSNGGFTWYLGSGITKGWTNTTQDGTNWPAGEVRISVRAVEESK